MSPDLMKIHEELTVGQLADRSGVTVSALHFYERQGLIGRDPIALSVVVATVPASSTTGGSHDELRHP